MNEYSVFLASLVCGLLWLVVGVPLVSRVFGTALPINPRKRGAAIREMRFGAYLWVYGVLGWGVAMFIAMSLDEYLRWRLLGAPYSKPSAALIVVHALGWLAAGALFGWLSWRGNHPLDAPEATLPRQ